MSMSDSFFFFNKRLLMPLSGWNLNLYLSILGSLPHVKADNGDAPNCQIAITLQLKYKNGIFGLIKSR